MTLLVGIQEEISGDVSGTIVHRTFSIVNQTRNNVIVCIKTTNSFTQLESVFVLIYKVANIRHSVEVHNTCLCFRSLTFNDGTLLKDSCILHRKMRNHSSIIVVRLINCVDLINVGRTKGNLIIFNTCSVQGTVSQTILNTVGRVGGSLNLHHFHFCSILQFLLCLILRNRSNQATRSDTSKTRNSQRCSGSTSRVECDA